MKIGLKSLRKFGGYICAALLLCSLILMNPASALSSIEAKGNVAAEQSGSKNNGVYVARNLRTGEITVTEPQARARQKASELKPHIPEGLEIAQPSKNIIGEDNRIEVTNVDAFPNSAVVYLEIEYQDGTTVNGSGAFVGDTMILTAGHNVYEPEYGWAKSITAKPGGSASSFETASAVSVASTFGWVDESDKLTTYEYGLIEVDKRLNAGMFGLASLTDETLSNAVLMHLGYSGDKPEGTLWSSHGVAGKMTAEWFKHTMDTTEGNSGGPIMQQTELSFIVGVHYGNVVGDNDYNIAARVNQRMIDFVTTYLPPAE